MSKLYDTIEAKIMSDLAKVKELILNPPNPVFAYALTMERQDVYAIFHQSIDCLYGIEMLSSMIVNGFYDDSEFHIKKQVNKVALDLEEHVAEYENREVEVPYEYVLDYSARLEDESHVVTVPQILQVMQVHKEASDYYRAHEKEINECTFENMFNEDHPNSIWFELRQKCDEIMKSIYKENLR